MFCKHMFLFTVLKDGISYKEIIVDRLGYPDMSAHYLKVRVNY